MLLDLYGTNHDARIWGDPEVFRPSGSESRTGAPSTLSPKGAVTAMKATVVRASGSR